MTGKERLVRRLKWLWIAALVSGAASFAGGLYWINSPNGPGLDWVWGIAAFGAAAVVYNIALFALCSIFVPGLSKLVVDDTEVHGDTVTHVVRHAEVGDAAIDPYIKAYATARGTCAVAIISSIMIAVAWSFF